MKYIVRFSAKCRDRKSFALIAPPPTTNNGSIRRCRGRTGTCVVGRLDPVAHEDMPSPQTHQRASLTRLSERLKGIN